MLKKTLSTLMVLTLIVLFALTYFCSIRTERLFTEAVTLSNRIAAGKIRIELKRYQRHLFTATAVTSVIFTATDTVTFHHQIRHFAWGSQITTTLENQSASGKNSTSDTPADPLSLITDISLSGGASSRLQQPESAFHLSMGRCEFSGLDLSWRLTSGLSTTEFSGRLDELRLKQGVDTQDIKISGLQFYGSLTDLQAAPAGFTELSIKRLRFVKPGTTDFALYNLRWREQLEATSGHYNNLTDLIFDKLSLTGENFSHGRLRLRISDIGPELLSSFWDTAKLWRGEPSNRQDLGFGRQFSLLALSSELLHSGITLDLEELFLETAEGDMQATGTLTLSNDATTPPFSLTHLKAKFLLDIDQAVFIAGYRLFNNLLSHAKPSLNPAVLSEQGEQIIGGLVQKNIFVRTNGNRYQVKLGLIGGRGELNGKPFRLN